MNELYEINTVEIDNLFKVAANDAHPDHITAVMKLSNIITEHPDLPNITLKFCNEIMPIINQKNKVHETIRSDIFAALRKVESSGNVPAKSYLEKHVEGYELGTWENQSIEWYLDIVLKNTAHVQLIDEFCEKISAKSNLGHNAQFDYGDFRDHQNKIYQILCAASEHNIGSALYLRGVHEGYILRRNLLKGEFQKYDPTYLKRSLYGDNRKFCELAQQHFASKELNEKIESQGFYILGEYYSEDRMFTKKDSEKVTEFMQLAAKADVAAAHVWLGDCYAGYRSNITPLDYTIASQFYLSSGITSSEVYEKFKKIAQDHSDHSDIIMNYAKFLNLQTASNSRDYLSKLKNTLLPGAHSHSEETASNIAFMEQLFSQGHIMAGLYLAEQTNDVTQKAHYYKLAASASLVEAYAGLTQLQSTHIPNVLAYIGICRLKSYGTYKDVDAAKQIFIEALKHANAEQQDFDFACAVLDLPKIVVKPHSMSAQAFDVLCNILGNLAEQQRNFPNALFWYKRAALHTIGAPEGKEYSVKRLREIAASTTEFSKAASNIIIEAILKGTVTAVNQTEASIIQRADEGVRVYQQACCHLAGIEPYPYNPNKAIELLTAGLKNQKVDLTLQIQGILLTLAKTMPDDSHLHYALGLSYKLANKYDEAFKHWESAAQAGHAIAAYNTGIYYLQGVYVEKNVTKAIERFIFASGYPEIRNEAVTQLKPFRENNVVAGIYYAKAMIAMYPTTLQPESIKLLVTASRQGHAEADIELAKCLRYGFGVPKDPVKAGYLYAKVFNAKKLCLTEAVRGLTELSKSEEQAPYTAYTLLALAECYEYGIALPVSLTTAIWYYLKILSVAGNDFPTKLCIVLASEKLQTFAKAYSINSHLLIEASEISHFKDSVCQMLERYSKQFNVTNWKKSRLGFPLSDAIPVPIKEIGDLLETAINSKETVFSTCRLLVEKINEARYEPKSPINDFLLKLGATLDGLALNKIPSFYENNYVTMKLTN